MDFSSLMYGGSGAPGGSAGVGAGGADAGGKVASRLHAFAPAVEEMRASVRSVNSDAYIGRAGTETSAEARSSKASEAGADAVSMQQLQAGVRAGADGRLPELSDSHQAARLHRINRQLSRSMILEQSKVPGGASDRSVSQGTTMPASTGAEKHSALPLPDGYSSSKVLARPEVDFASLMSDFRPPDSPSFGQAPYSFVGQRTEDTPNGRPSPASGMAESNQDSPMPFQLHAGFREFSDERYTPGSAAPLSALYAKGAGEERFASAMGAGASMQGPLRGPAANDVRAGPSPLGGDPQMSPPPQAVSPGFEQQAVYSNGPKIPAAAAANYEVFESEIMTLEDELNQAYHERTQLEAELMRLQDQNMIVQRRATEAEANVQIEANRADAAKKSLRECMTRLDELESKLSLSAGGQSTSRDADSRLRAELAQARARSVELEGTVTALQRELGKLDAQSKSTALLEEKLDALQKERLELAGSSSQLAKMESEFARLQARLASTDKDAVELREKLGVSQSEGGKLRDELRANDHEIKKLREESAKLLFDAENRIELLTHEVQTLKRALASCEAVIGEKGGEAYAERMKAIMSEHEGLLAENKRNEAIIADLQARESALLGVLRDLEMQVRDRGMAPISQEGAAEVSFGGVRARSGSAGAAHSRGNGPLGALFALSMRGIRFAVAVTVVGVAVVACVKAAEQGLSKMDTGTETKETESKQNSE
ncbi:hypothetical protein FVE85_0483 [Porphyridium purpureum]|uniref:Uncharacterized protein n=1 Tax=Porphyridium purpureum TaxID=35688 RepID=A0A5J4Z1E4_PORPP|nr:hypothetical protein FVE85_0483 [Porphyridium purpureum]|eukprot:POR7008..scf208_2